MIVSGKLRAQRAKSMKFKDGYMVSSGNPVREYIDTATRHVLLRQVRWGRVCYRKQVGHAAVIHVLLLCRRSIVAGLVLCLIFDHQALPDCAPTCRVCSASRCAS